MASPSTQPFLEWNDAFASEWNSPGDISNGEQHFQALQGTLHLDPSSPATGDEFALGQPSDAPSELEHPAVGDGPMMGHTEMTMVPLGQPVQRVEDSQLRALRDHYELELARERAAHEMELAGTRDQLDALEARLELSRYAALGSPYRGEEAADVFQSPARGRSTRMANDDNDDDSGSKASSPASSLFREAGRGLDQTLRIVSPRTAAVAELTARGITSDPNEVRHCRNEIASLNRRLDRASESLCKVTYAVKVLHFKLQQERKTVAALQADKCSLQARLLQFGGRCPDWSSGRLDDNHRHEASLPMMRNNGPFVVNDDDGKQQQVGGRDQETSPSTLAVYESGMAELARRLAIAEDAAATVDGLREELVRSRAASEVAARRELEAEERGAAVLAEAERLSLELMAAREQAADLRHELAGRNQEPGIQADDGLPSTKLDEAHMYGVCNTDATEQQVVDLQQQLEMAKTEHKGTLEQLSIAERELSLARARITENEAVTQHVVGDLSDLSGLVDAVQSLQARNRELTDALEEASAGNEELMGRNSLLAERANDLDTSLSAETRLRAQAEAEAETAAAKAAALQEALEQSVREERTASRERDAAFSKTRQCQGVLRETLHLLQQLNAERSEHASVKGELNRVRLELQDAQQQQQHDTELVEETKRSLIKAQADADAADRRVLHLEQTLADLSEELSVAQDRVVQQADALRDAQGTVSVLETRLAADHGEVLAFATALEQICDQLGIGNTTTNLAVEQEMANTDSNEDGRTTTMENESSQQVEKATRPPGRLGLMLEALAEQATVWRQASDSIPDLERSETSLRDELERQKTDISSLESQNATLRSHMEFVSDELSAARAETEGQKVALDSLKRACAEHTASLRSACTALHSAVCQLSGEQYEPSWKTGKFYLVESVDDDAAWKVIWEDMIGALHTMANHICASGAPKTTGVYDDDALVLRSLCRLALAVTMDHVSAGHTENARNVVLEVEPLIVQQEAALERLGLHAAWHTLCQLATRDNKTLEKEEAKKSTGDAGLSLRPSERAIQNQSDQEVQQLLMELSGEVGWVLGQESGVTEPSSVPSSQALAHFAKAVRTLVRRYRAALRVMQGKSFPTDGTMILRRNQISRRKGTCSETQLVSDSENSMSYQNIGRGKTSMTANGDDQWSNVSLRDRYGSQMTTPRMPLTATSSTNFT